MTEPALSVSAALALLDAAEDERLGLRAAFYKLQDRAETAEALAERRLEALTRISEQQPKTREMLRSNGIVFDGPIGNDPKNWQHVAFSIYTDLCEVDSIACAALADEG